MPQMAPMMWLTLMMFFNTMIIMMTLNYFSTRPLPSQVNFSIETNTINWSW